MTLRASNAAGIFAAFAMLVAVFAGQQSAVLVASASAVALLSAALWFCVVSVLIAGTAQAAHADAAARSSLRDTAFLPLRDPDAAGRPRPRAPGAYPATV
ncbi:DUF6412 domain-containing protein [Catenulispora subtropica]|uniref:Uncharacterized protein n=1 Tax=Catenulispora subtropica TaxID=450798 RepID=A0ABP5DQ72_9ACTN